MVTYYPYDTDTSTASTASSNDYDTSTCTYYVPVQRMLVHYPESWTKEIAFKFSELLNLETKTGWKIILVINGDITIMDPSIEVRTMKDFLPLLRSYACGEDREKIDAFFEQHPA